jgi:putative Mg2+ transporter-C (MgtC) family protein
MSNGKPSDSFVVMDIMRLPLGILSGIGFIGAGAILKRGEMIVGLTTAATLWFVTVMGLCFGGGQTGLGLASFGLAFVILSGLKKVEDEMPRAQIGKLRVNVSVDGPDRLEIESLLNAAGVSPMSISIACETSPVGDKEFGWKLKWNARGRDTAPPPVIGQLAKRADIRRLEFTR